MNAANNNNDLLSALLVHPITTNTNVNITNEAIVIPDTGRLDVPIVPVKRPATITNNNDNIKETIAPTIAIFTLPDIMNAATNAITIPPISINISPELPSELPSLADLAFKVSFTETIIVGISFIAPIRPPQSIIPAPMYLT
ncbi:hypothetical protein SDC9_158595 [bioreactor metagenome]|uniref:Uncharacterized protein n=1 Tax=bioreactor metagenome TaxID=1076179 RepID=A0A645FFL9_9ZZZZ